MGKKNRSNTVLFMILILFLAILILGFYIKIYSLENKINRLNNYPITKNYQDGDYTLSNAYINSLNAITTNMQFSNYYFTFLTFLITLGLIMLGFIGYQKISDIEKSVHTKLYSTIRSDVKNDLKTEMEELRRKTEEFQKLKEEKEDMIKKTGSTRKMDAEKIRAVDELVKDKINKVQVE